MPFSTVVALSASEEEKEKEMSVGAVEEEKEEISSSNDPLDDDTTIQANGACHQDGVEDGTNVSDTVSRPPTNSPLFASPNFNDHLSKQRASLVSSDVGVTHVDEPAPNLNLRFFRISSRRFGLGTSLNEETRSRMATSELRPMSNILLEETEMTASVRRANSMIRSSLSGSGFSRANSLEDSPRNIQGYNWRRMSSPFSRRTDSNQGSNVLINATLVEPMEVAEAEPITFFQKHGKGIGSIAAFLLVAFITFMTLTLKGVLVLRPTPMPTSVPSSMPSMAPSFDPRPTLQIVQDRGSVRCGMHQSTTPGTFRYQLCQAIAAVALNNSDGMEIIHVTSETRFVALNDRTVDVLSGGETYTIEREVNEPTTRAHFTFSAPYYYDGMAFAGNQTFVQCAEEQKRYDECSQMVICVTRSTTDYGYVAGHFTSDFSLITSGLDESIQSYFNETCNVIASSRLDLLNYKYGHEDLLLSTIVIGDNTFNNDPLSYVTRPDDHEWSNLVNWVVQALFFGERQGIGKNESTCKNNSNPSALNASSDELDFLNAVYCVGNYAEIYNSSELAEYRRTVINTINNGTPMLYVIPYGDLNNANEQMFYNLSKTFADVRSRNQLNCGLLIQDGYAEDLISSEALFGMSVSFCQTLASSMLDGNLYGVNYTTFQDVGSSMLALNNGAIDVLLGVAAHMSYNFGNQTLDGVTFSASYYYGNETENTTEVAFYPIMTRQEDGMFSSFINCIVLSTFYASSEGMDEKDSYLMPLISLFGNDMFWSLKDAISANGNYDEIYSSNFNNVENRGRNALNTDQMPELLDMPGLQA